jgi:hypothetical protein
MTNHSVTHYSNTPVTHPHPPRGQVGWMPRLPAAGAGRKADPIIISTLPGSPCHACPVLTGWAGASLLR